MLIFCLILTKTCCINCSQCHRLDFTEVAYLGFQEILGVGFALKNAQKQQQKQMQKIVPTAAQLLQVRLLCVMMLYYSMVLVAGYPWLRVCFKSAAEAETEALQSANPCCCHTYTGEL